MSVFVSAGTVFLTTYLLYPELASLDAVRVIETQRIHSRPSSGGAPNNPQPIATPSEVGIPFLAAWVEQGDGLSGHGVHTFGARTLTDVATPATPAQVTRLISAALPWREDMVLRKRSASQALGETTILTRIPRSAANQLALTQFAEVHRRLPMASAFWRDRSSRRCRSWSSSSVSLPVSCPSHLDFFARISNRRCSRSDIEKRSPNFPDSRERSRWGPSDSRAVLPPTFCRSFGKGTSATDRLPRRRIINLSPRAALSNSSSSLLLTSVTLTTVSIVPPV